MSCPSLVTGEPETFSSATIASSMIWFSRWRMISKVTASTGTLMPASPPWAG